MTKQNVCVGTLACVGTLVCVGTLERRPDQASGTLASNSKMARQRLRCTAQATVLPRVSQVDHRPGMMQHPGLLREPIPGASSFITCCQ